MCVCVHICMVCAYETPFFLSKSRQSWLFLCPLSLWQIPSLHPMFFKYILLACPDISNRAIWLLSRRFSLSSFLPMWFTVFPPFPLSQMALGWSGITSRLLNSSTWPRRQATSWPSTTWPRCMPPVPVWCAPVTLRLKWANLLLLFFVC